MIYNVAQLLKEGIGAARQYKIDGDLSDIDEYNPGPVPVVGTAKMVRTPDGILVSAQAHLELVQPCRRCLELTRTPVDVAFEEEFVPSIDVESGILLTGAEMSEAPELLIDEHHILDLTELMRQYAVMEATRLAICSPDCKGLCPTCGQNLNVAQCECADESIDPRMAALAKLLHTGTEGGSEPESPTKGSSR